MTNDSTEQLPEWAIDGKIFAKISPEFERYWEIRPLAADFIEYGAGYPYFPEWPNIGYLKIPITNRIQYLNRLQPKPRKAWDVARQLYPAQADWFSKWSLEKSANFVESLLEGNRTNGWPMIRFGTRHPVDWALLAIPRDATRPELCAAFDAFLEKIGREEVKHMSSISSKGGAGSVPRRLMYSLQALEAYRRHKDGQKLQALGMFTKRNQLVAAIDYATNILNTFRFAGIGPRAAT
jgi:hypothetical protein